MANYDSEYYEGNDQSNDRKALDFYYRLFKHEMGTLEGGERVLEYGSGVGHLTKRLSRDFETYALDISDYALSQVNINAPKAKTIKSTAKIKNGSLDGVIALHVLEHIEDPSVTLKDFYAKLKPGGTMMFVVPNPDGLGHKMKKEKWFGFSDETHISLFPEKRWLELTVDQKFNLTKVKGDGLWDVPYVPLVPLFLQKLFFFPPAAIQFLTGRVFLPTRFGECLIVVAKKK